MLDFSSFRAWSSESKMEAAPVDDDPGIEEEEVCEALGSLDKGWDRGVRVGELDEGGTDPGGGVDMPAICSSSEQLETRRWGGKWGAKYVR